MKSPMTHAGRVELANAIRERYANAKGSEKHAILEEFIAATGYHKKSAIRVLNGPPPATAKKTRRRRSIYDDAVRAALIVLWEASDRICGKRLKALLPILLPALERNGHLSLQAEIRAKILSMSAASIDRLLKTPRLATVQKRKRRTEPEPRRRIKLRTFADWCDPPPGSMEMDLVAHCGAINRGSYINSVVMTDIATGWTEAAPIVFREGSLVVETVEKIRQSLPFSLVASDVDNGSEFVNNRLVEYCLSHGIELTRSRPYRKNDQAWIEQKNGAVVRKLLGYQRFEGLAAARAIARLYAASRLFVNFFQPSFKLAEKHRDGALVAKRYHPPQTPCERLLRAEGIPDIAKENLRNVAAALDPLKLLEEIRAVQAYLATLAAGEAPMPPTSDPPDLVSFVGSLSSAWRDGEVRPTFSMDCVPRYLRGLQQTPKQEFAVNEAKRSLPVASAVRASPEQVDGRKPIYAEPGCAKVQALRMAWPIACRRLEELPNISAAQLFEELCIQFPGRFTRKQYKTFARRVSDWRKRARERGVVVGPKTYRRHSDKARGRRPEIFSQHWPEMVECLEQKPDQTALELLAEFQTRHPGEYSLRQLNTLQRRVRAWRQDAVSRLISDLSGPVTAAGIRVHVPPYAHPN